MLGSSIRVTISSQDRYYAFVVIAVDYQRWREFHAGADRLGAASCGRFGCGGSETRCLKLHNRAQSCGFRALRSGRDAECDEYDESVETTGRAPISRHYGVSVAWERVLRRLVQCRSDGANPFAQPAACWRFFSCGRWLRCRWTGGDSDAGFRPRRLPGVIQRIGDSGTAPLTGLGSLLDSQQFNSQ